MIQNDHAFGSVAISQQCEREEDEADSLFGSDHDDELPLKDDTQRPLSLQHQAATSITPPIPGLYVFPKLLPQDTASKLMQEIAKSDIFCAGERNQAMLFTSADCTASSSLPPYLEDLTGTLESLIAPYLPASTTGLLFHPRPETATSRQIILNLYKPGEGITPHIDLPGRYADGIIGVCLGSGCVMDFEDREEAETEEGERHKGPRKYSVYMPARTVYCLTDEARWSWAHGIPSRDRDVVMDADGKVATILRDVRISVTLRWMKPGAEVLR
ncbi:hypothetical protein QFC21_003520 [Naganishia friedmannii]|uniref:Uncharacterized protein n=1 Tax=Naganishia friedmannii TaxID=89922 RepID=A0ACC2VPC0_9TREE|nr:hypothetical protein QFC21_003520 [Naganishia friedmannii]